MNEFRADQTGAELRPSPNFGVRRGGARPDAVILHYTGMDSGQGAEDWLCDPRSEVSSHYIVHEDGRVVQMVREADRAWHAGAGSWAGREDVNSFSIGIEIVNPGHLRGCPPYPDPQIEAVIVLCGDVCVRWQVRAERVLAHSDIAPGRKGDPGEHFPWARLARAGIGHHVAPAPLGGGRFLSQGDRGEPVEALQSMLALYGYGLDVTGEYDGRTVDVVTAFQRHFRQERVDGVADRSTIETLHRLQSGLTFREI